MLCAIRYHLHNLKTVKNTPGGVSKIVQMVADRANYPIYKDTTAKTFSMLI